MHTDVNGKCIKVFVYARSFTIVQAQMGLKLYRIAGCQLLRDFECIEVY